MVSNWHDPNKSEKGPVGIVWHRNGHASNATFWSMFLKYRTRRLENMTNFRLKMQCYSFRDYFKSRVIFFSNFRKPCVEYLKKFQLIQFKYFLDIYEWIYKCLKFRSLYILMNNNSMLVTKQSCISNMNYIRWQSSTGGREEVKRLQEEESDVLLVMQKWLTLFIAFPDVLFNIFQCVLWCAVVLMHPRLPLSYNYSNRIM